MQNGKVLKLTGGKGEGGRGAEGFETFPPTSQRPLPKDQKQQLS